MCNEFLSVTWIDKKRRFGYSHFQLYSPNGKLDSHESIGLIHLDKYSPRFDYNLGIWLEQRKPDDVFSVIQNGRIINQGINWPELTFEQLNGKQITFQSFSHYRDLQPATLSDNFKNVCIPYPDGQLMWIAEYKHAEKVYSHDEIMEKSRKAAPFLQQFIAEENLIPDEMIRLLSAGLDVNFDGIEDYLGGVFIYSNKGQYYLMTPMWRGQLDNNFGKFKFPPTNRTCEILLPAFYVTTDGKSYFLNNQCNLTVLTKEGK